MSIPQWLLDLGIPASCIEQRSAAKEKGRNFSIAPMKGDTIWRIHMDDCWIKGHQSKRVDYLFWGQSSSGRNIVIVVELKGKQVGTALKQIEQTLQHLCKKSSERGIHTGKHHQAPRHDTHSKGGIKVYVVHSGGKNINQHQTEIERIRKRYGIRVHFFENRLSVKGLDKLP